MSSKRFVVVCVPGRDEGDDASWFVVDMEAPDGTRRCADRHEAARLAGELEKAEARQ